MTFLEKCGNMIEMVDNFLLSVGLILLPNIILVKLWDINLSFGLSSTSYWVAELQEN